MSSNSRPVSALVIAAILVAGIGVYSWWQREQKEAERAKIFRSMVVPAPAKKSSPAERKALMDAISGKKTQVPKTQTNAVKEPLNMYR